MTRVGDATHFHVPGTGGSSWNAGLLKVAQIGAHVFYRFGGHNGSPSMFHETPHPSDGASVPRPVFASLSLSSGAPNSTTQEFLAKASAAVEHAASVVENAARGGTPAEAAKPAPAAKPQAAPAPAAEEANKTGAPAA
jgi:hypothetical protein